MCLLPCLGHLQEADPRPSFPALSLSMSPFALAWMLSHAVTELGEGEGDKSHDIMVLTFPLWKPKHYDSLGFCPGFQRKRDCINMACVCTSGPSVTLSLLLASELSGRSWRSWAEVWSSRRYQVPTDFVKMGSFRGEIDFQSSLGKESLQLGLNPC